MLGIAAARLGSELSTLTGDSLGTPVRQEPVLFYASFSVESAVQRGKITYQSHPAVSIHPAGPGPSSCPSIAKTPAVGKPGPAGPGFGRQQARTLCLAPEFLWRRAWGSGLFSRAHRTCLQSHTVHGGAEAILDPTPGAHILGREGPSGTGSGWRLRDMLVCWLEDWRSPSARRP